MTKDRPSVPRPHRAALLLALPLVAACAPFPDVPTPAGAAGDFPALLPIDALLAEADHARP